VRTNGARRDDQRHREQDLARPNHSLETTRQATRSVLSCRRTAAVRHRGARKRVSRTIRIGTRGSKLALAQAQLVQASLQNHYPDLDAALVTITTTGDRFLEQPLSTIGGKGEFVKEIEDALDAKTIDCAVHSLKDVPSELAPGLVLAAIPRRSDP